MLETFQYIVFPCRPSDGGEIHFAVFQVLAVNPKCILANTYEPNTESDFTVEMQPFADAAPSCVKGLRQVYHLHALEDPQSYDLLAMIGVSFQTRSELFVLQRMDSDLMGCFCLHKPEVLRPIVDVGRSFNLPPLCIFDRLIEVGFQPVLRLVNHVPATAQIFDARCASTKGAYFRCVLMLADLFKAGLSGMKSNGIVA